MSKNKTLKIKQIKSSIGYKKKAKLTLKALGLKKINQIVEHKDTPELRGMINVVNYLVNIEESK
jgi:large subunit ribosomal protein L30